MERRTFLTLSALTASSTLFGISEEIDSSLVKRGSNSLVTSLLKKLIIVQNQVGYVQFNILSFDDLLKVASRCKKPLQPSEIDFIESIFYGDPRKYGFYGERTVPNLTIITPQKDVPLSPCWFSPSCCAPSVPAARRNRSGAFPFSRTAPVP